MKTGKSGAWSSSATRGDHSAPAFTLLELLVVVGIISVLAMLLLPVLAKAKHEARRIECLSRQKQWAMAFLQYVDDNDGWIPREGYHFNGSVYENNWAQVRSGDSHDTWYNALPEYLSTQPAADYFLPSKRLSFYERSSFFHCPSAPFPKQTRNIWYQTAVFSLAMNSQLIQPPEPASVKFSRIKDPTRTALFLDNLLEGEKSVVPQQAKSNLGQPSANASRFAGRRHGRSGNLAFADGHVATLRGEKVVQTKGMTAGWAIVPIVDVGWELDEQ
jgi:prepilin-type processing-associated H-X9-DG protein/prepilin-type N-terminal cleavage/methylation domain-containing protein